MAKRKRIEDLCRKFKNDMQKLVDKSDGGITGISMTVGDKTVTIAKKNDKEARPCESESTS